MATHPTPHDAPHDDEGADDGAQNPSRLPVEPEFAPGPPVSDPEDPTSQPAPT